MAVNQIVVLKFHHNDAEFTISLQGIVDKCCQKFIMLNRAKFI